MTYTVDHNSLMTKSYWEFELECGSNEMLNVWLNGKKIKGWQKFEWKIFQFLKFNKDLNWIEHSQTRYI